MRFHKLHSNCLSGANFNPRGDITDTPAIFRTDTWIYRKGYALGHLRQKISKWGILKALFLWSRPFDKTLKERLKCFYSQYKQDNN